MPNLENVFKKIFFFICIRKLTFNFALLLPAVISSYAAKYSCTSPELHAVLQQMLSRYLNAKDTMKACENHSVLKGMHMCRQFKDILLFLLEKKESFLLWLVGCYGYLSKALRIMAHPTSDVRAVDVCVKREGAEACCSYHQMCRQHSRSSAAC